jgi:hypothetical protein
MSDFAKVIDGVVVNVIVADQAFIDTQSDKDDYIETWADANGDPAKRYNYAGIGFAYDKVKNAFVEPQPSEEATFDEVTMSWVMPPMKNPEADKT